MPLIDGTYEILEQRPTGDARTLVRATDPDGMPVRIVWYDVTPDTELSFERYRRTLRRLSREEDVLLRDVVSRPGARYAVWDDPADAPPAQADAAWRERLERAGLDVAQADVRRRGRELVLAGLDWTDDPDDEDPIASGSEAEARPHAHASPAGGRVRLPHLGSSGRSWVATALLLLVSFGFGLIGWDWYANDDAVTVPDVMGATAAEAIEMLDRSGFAVETRSVLGDGTPFTVVGIDPSAGAALRPGRTVRIDYLRPDAGATEQEIPTLAGRTLADATERLTDSELTLGSVARVPSATPPGTVLAQRPEPGPRRLPTGATIDLLVSQGPRPSTTFVPDVVGLPLDEARRWVRLAGLPADRILVDPVQADDVPTGEVVAMTPSAWQPVHLDAITVRLLVSDPDGSVALGREPGTGAPDLVGLDAARARAALAAAGVDVQERRIAQSALPDGVVLQDPAPGEPLGDTMSLVVNARPRALPIPQPEVRIQAPRLRWIPYRFLVEPGIPEQQAELRATTVEGDTFLVLQRSVVGGDTIDGVWGTVTPGAVSFELSLNGVPYAESRVTRDVELR